MLNKDTLKQIVTEGSAGDFDLIDLQSVKKDYRGFKGGSALTQIMIFVDNISGIQYSIVHKEKFYRQSREFKHKFILSTLKQLA